MTRRSVLLTAAAVPFAKHAQAFQGDRLSPHDTASIDLSGKAITISYGRPYMKGRRFGQDVAPDGTVWRLGADEATKLTVPAPTKVEGGPTLAAGSYSLWAIPGATKWTMIVNKQADVWGTRYDKSHDVARFDLPVKKVPAIEQFTITFAKQSDTAAHASFAWGTQSVSTTLTLS